MDSFFVLAAAPCCLRAPLVATGHGELRLCGWPQAMTGWSWYRKTPVSSLLRRHSGTCSTLSPEVPAGSSPSYPQWQLLHSASFTGFLSFPVSLAHSTQGFQDHLPNKLFRFLDSSQNQTWGYKDFKWQLKGNTNKWLKSERQVTGDEQVFMLKGLALDQSFLWGWDGRD